ncbi:MAG: TAXI family TRAP transporter solute-binding subunit [Deltaproteobacteria bacterium]|nr:TAXI family TRAP transporter solute-binding subunit [Deltaproteobacteria bacterium]
MKTKSTNGVITAILTTLAALILLDAGPARGAKVDCSPVRNTSADLPRTTTIGTNPTGTGAHAMGTALAAVGSNHTPISVKVQPHSGPNAWISLLQNGELEFGIINTIDSYMAMTGTGNFEKPSPALRVVSGGVFPFFTGIFVRDRSDIKELKDLRGKRLAWDYGGHAANQTFLNAALEIAGVKPSDIIQVRVSNMADGTRAVVEGRVDATNTGVGIAINEEANAREPIRFLSVPNTEAANKILVKVGASVAKGPATTGVKEGTTMIGYPLTLAGSTHVSERTVYTLVKTWWENLGEIQPKHPLLKRWTKETQAITNFTAPYHPGAIKFYKEVGAWTAKHEARSKEICQ